MLDSSSNCAAGFQAKAMLDFFLDHFGFFLLQCGLINCFCIWFENHLHVLASQYAVMTVDQSLVSAFQVELICEGRLTWSPENFGCTIEMDHHTALHICICTCAVLYCSILEHIRKRKVLRWAGGLQKSFFYVVDFIVDKLIDFQENVLIIFYAALAVALLYVCLPQAAYMIQKEILMEIYSPPEIPTCANGALPSASQVLCMYEDVRVRSICIHGNTSTICQQYSIDISSTRTPMWMVDKKLYEHLYNSFDNAMIDVSALEGFCYKRDDWCYMIEGDILCVAHGSEPHSPLSEVHIRIQIYVIYEITHRKR